MADSDALTTAQHFIFVTQIYFCCMYSVVVWDWIVSLPREYKFIWKSSWTAAKISYLFCRYWILIVMPYVLTVFVADHSVETCQKIYKSPVALAMWNQAGAEVVLLIRTYAFFNRNNNLLVVLCMGLAGVLSYQLYVAIEQMLPLPFVTPPFDKGPCFPMSKPHSAHLLGFFMASLAFDAGVTTMTLWKALRIRRMCGATTSPLIQTFLREGVFYFVLISIANLINGIFYLQPKAVMSAINIPLSIMFSDVLACRMILDLRERGFELSQPTTMHTPHLPIHADFPDGLRDTSTTSSDPSSPNKSAPPHTPVLYPRPLSQYGPKKGLRGLVGRGGRNTTSSALTTTIDSAMFSQTGSGLRTHDGSVELRSFTPRHNEADEKPDMDEDSVALSYPMVDMAHQDSPGASDVSVNVEKTTSL
ncbi:hypothetical protein DFH11DRAFT_755414 [Phellopilus nigrolimitatus]|nr:hypothetical protein DFH11DRAFT_755414 [Phellopilus nigrolimitatus]